MIDCTAEQGVIGAILLDNKLMADLALQPQDFANYDLRKVFTVARQLQKDDKPIDVVTLGHLKLNSLLANCMAAVPSPSDGVIYAEQVAKDAKQRNVQEILRKAQLQMQEGNADEVSALVMKQLQEVDTDMGEFYQLSDLSGVEHERICRAMAGDVEKGITTGIDKWNQVYGGLQRSDLVIIAARPSMGKTAFMLNMMMGVEVPVGIFSLEMGKEQLMQRLLAQHSGVNLKKIRDGSLEKADYTKLNQSFDYLNREKKITVVGDAMLTADQIYTKTIKMQRQHGVQVVFVDYLQLINGDRKKSRVEDVTEISRSLKVMANQLNIVVVAASQLSRAVENRPNKRPILSDLRESGAIEQDADIVGFLFSQDYYDDPVAPNKHTELRINKNRNDALYVMDFNFNGATQRFTSLTDQQVQRLKADEEF